jgi:hypothetical protein
MSEYSEVLATTRFVVENARYVMIDSERVQVVAEQIASAPPPAFAFDCVRHPCGPDPSVANIVLVLDALNFSFWPDPGQPRWRVTYRGETANGYWALVAALRRALDEGVPLADASFLAEISDAEVADLLRGEGTIPMLPERAAALREVGRVLRARYHGAFVNAIEAADRDARMLVRLLARDFSSFNDVASYGGYPVYFYKRAQICCGDLHGMSQGAWWGNLSHLDHLTAFADYKVPQVLRELGVLVYTEALARTVDERRLLPAGSPGEVEIRAATVWAVEMIRRALDRRGIHRRAVEIDWYLWELGQRLPGTARPYHLTRTIYY